MISADKYRDAYKKAVDNVDWELYAQHQRVLFPYANAEFAKECGNKALECAIDDSFAHQLRMIAQYKGVTLDFTINGEYLMCSVSFSVGISNSCILK